jgi:glycosyltransferase involved in cell wall biosynthesis
VITDRDLHIEKLNEHVDNLENIHIKNLNEHVENLEKTIANLRDFERKVKSTLLYRSYRFLRLHKMHRLVTNDTPTPEAEVYSARELSITQESVPHVLFISHDAYRTGAPMVLLHFLKWFKANTSIPFIILLKDANGELREEFEELAPVMTWSQSSLEKANEAVIDSIREHLGHTHIGLIYSNTITNGKVLAGLSNLHSPVICHVHELEYWIDHKIEPDNMRLVKEHTHHYIAVSQAVKHNLIENVKIPEEKIDVVHEFIPTQYELEDQSAEPERIRNRLKIPKDALVIGACGTPDWRKGSDLFIQLARSVLRRPLDRPVHFIWVGGEVGRKNGGPKLAALMYDVKRAHLEKHIHFVGNQSDPLNYFATFDVFVLVSREDPFPIVNLEAASLGKPIVCFDGSGGAPEFVEEDCGFVVPYLDLDAMADRVVELLRHPELKQRLGQQAARKVRERHDVTTAAPKILNIIQRFL